MIYGDGILDDLYVIYHEVSFDEQILLYLDEFYITLYHRVSKRCSVFPTYPGQSQFLDILRLGDGPPVTVTSVGPAPLAGPQSRPQPLDVWHVVPGEEGHY